MDILFMETIGINIGFPLLSWKGMGRISSEEKPIENQKKINRKPKRIRPPRPAARRPGDKKRGRRKTGTLCRLSGRRSGIRTGMRDVETPRRLRPHGCIRSGGGLRCPEADVREKNANQEYHINIIQNMERILYGLGREKCMPDACPFIRHRVQCYMAVFALIDRCKEAPSCPAKHVLWR